MDIVRPLTRQAIPLSVLGAVCEAEGEGLDVVRLIYETLRLRRATWRMRQEEALAELLRRNATTWAARRYLAGGITARQAGATWNVKPSTVRQRATRIRRDEEQKTATKTSAEPVSAAP